MLRPRPLAALILAAILVCLASLWPRVTKSDSVLRRITNTPETGINLNPSISGDGRHIAFESTEDLTNAGGASGFHAFQADLATNPTQFLQMTLSRAVAPGISQDGSRIAFASSSDPLGKNLDGNSEIFLFDSLANPLADVAALKQITDTTPAGVGTRVQDGSFQPSLSDDGRFIAFSSNRNLANQNGDANLEVFVFDTTAQTFTQITNTTGAGGASNVKISGDGSRIAYVSDAGTTLNPNRDLLLHNRQTATTQTIATSVNTVALTYGRAISDDGTRVVYSLQTATNTTQVFLFDSRANSARQITTLGARATDVSLNATISGDGKRIAFATRRNPLGTNSDASVELFLYDIPTTQLTQVTSATREATAEVISSLSDDGSVAVFSFPRVLSGAVADSDFADNSEIYSIGLAPRASSGTMTVLNGASFGNDPSSPRAIAPDSIAVAQGGALASVTKQAQPLSGGSFPLSLAGTSVTVNGRAAQIFYISPSQVNFLTPLETAIGPATVVVTNSDGFQTIGSIMVLSTAPGIFTYSGDGVGEGVILNAETLTPGPFDPTNGKLRLLVSATGVRGGSHATATIGGQAVPVEAVQPSTELPGLDEVQVFVPASLRGAGTVDLVIQSDGQASNPVSVTLTGSSLRDIMINEVLADPPGAVAADVQGDANHDGVRSGSDDEFVELVNSTTHDIDISGYQLLTRSSSATADTLRHTFTAGTILPACSAIVVFAGGNPDQSNLLFGAAQVVKTSSGLSLSNSGGVVTLRDNAAAVVTLFAYGGSTGLNGGASQSLTRSPDVTGNFVLHQSASGSGGKPFSSGTRLNATPFAPCPAAARVDVSPSSAAIDAGAKHQFSARASDAAGNEVFGVIFSWQSSNTSVATIDQTGLATGMLGGSTEIRASGRGVQSAPATLTVRDIQRVLTRIDVSPSSATIPATGAQQFIGHGFDQFGNEIAGLTFSWESTNPNAATIDQTGLATGINQGQSTIKASSQGVTGTATLNVTAPSIVVNEVLADPAGSVGTDLQGDANHDGVRSASDDEFVELVNSTGAGISLGGWTVRTRATGGTAETTRHTFATGTTLPASEAIVVFGGGTFNASDPVFGCAQVVRASSGGLSLTNAGLSILIRDGGGTLVSQMSYGAEGNNDQSLTRSPDISGAFVQHQAASLANGRRFSPGLKVDGTPFGGCPGHPASVNISPPASSVVVGQTTQFTAQAFGEFGRAMTGVPITFASDNTTAATVDSVSTNSSSGVATATVTGRNQGSAHITAQANDGTTTATSSQATLAVTTPPPQVTRVDVSPSTATINRGNTQQFNATAFDQNNQPVSGVFFTWSSNNTNAATVDQNGLATGVGVGTTTITASASDGASGTVSGTATLNLQVPLVINEINADVGPDNVATTAIEGDANRDGVRNSSDDEFVELFNNSTASVDISGIVIADATSNRFTIPANTTLASGRALVIFGGGSPPVNDPAFGGALVLALTGSGTLSLNDTGDTVNVKLNVGGSDLLIASQTYAGAGNPAAPSDQSLARSPDAEINSAGGRLGAHTTATNAAGRVCSPGTHADGTPFGSPAITRIDVTPASAAINAGQTQGFRARAFSNLGGPEVEVQNVCFIWESSDTSKATVAPTTGATVTATGVGGGNPAIRARAGGRLGTATLIVNVPPTLTVNDVSLNEGNSGTRTFHFVVSLSAPALATGVTFNIATQDNTATAADNDYAARTLTGQTIAAGQQTYDFDVTVNGDLNIEPNETFFVSVTNVSGATVGDGQGVGTIQNDDSPSLNISDVSASEGNSGTTTFTFTVTSTLPAPASGITFDIATADNVATVADNDYVARTLTGQMIPAGQTTYSFDVTVNGDLLVEPNEMFFVRVTNPSGASGQPQGQGTIQNDDNASLVISQIYGGGGNPTAVYQHDFVEIFNRGATTVNFSLTPYSVQYAGATSNFGSSKTDLTTGTMAPGQYFLIQGSAGASCSASPCGIALPAPDAIGTINLAGTSGKVALVAGTTALSAATCPGDDGSIPFNPRYSAIADFVGYGSTAGTTGNCYEGAGPAPAPNSSNTNADLRAAGGCTDTNENAADFATATPNPRNRASPPHDCNAPPTLTSVTITPSPATIGVGDTQQFTGQALDQFGQPIGGVTVSFAANDTNIASVDSVSSTSGAGLATAAVTGRTTSSTEIRATATNGSTNVTSSPARLTVEPAAGQVLISEFRTRGPVGATDEFIEVYNPTTSSVVIGGLLIRSSNSAGTLTTRATITNGLTMGPGCHYLLATASFSGSGTVPPDQSFTAGITDDGGIAITRSDLLTVIDALGMSAGSAYKEGTTLAPLAGTSNQSYERKPGGASGNGADTNNNANDFVLNVNTSNPQNSSSGCLATSTADLSISELDSPDPATVGSDITYTITVTNNGIGTAQNLLVTDNLPSSLAYVSCNATGGGVCGGTGNNRNVNFSSLAADSSATITLIATVNGTGDATISNTASVSAATTDRNSGNNSQTITTTVHTPADLSLTKVVSNSAPNVGGQVTFTITVSNGGPYPATSVSVKDQLPAGLTYLADDGAGSYVESTGIWTLGTVNASATRTLHITAQATSTAVNGVANIAEVVASDQFDPDSTPNNHSAGEDDQAGVSVTAQSANLSLTKTVDNSSPNLGQDVTFTITLKNAGPNAATTVQVKDSLPAGLLLVSSVQSQGSYSSSSGFWSIGSVNASGSATLTITATVQASGTITNTAEVIASDVFDPNSTPNNHNAMEDDQASRTISSLQADLSLSNTVDAASPVVGQEIAFTLTLNNAGPSMATGVRVTDLLPSGLLYVSSTVTQGTYDDSSGLWSAGTVNNGASQSLSIKARVQTQGAKTNTAMLSASDVADPNSSNNQSNVTFTPGLPQLVISQIYTAGGAAGAIYNRDFIEIFNRGAVSINLSGFSVQYAATGTGTFTVIASLPNVTLAPRQYFLIAAGTTNAGVGSNLPVTPDVTGSNTNLTGSVGKGALVFGTTALTSSNVNNPPLTVGNATPGCPTNAGVVVDFIGYGTTASCYEGGSRAPDPTTSNNSQSNFRSNGGCTDTNNNGLDFARANVAPRNSSTIKASCP